MAMYKQPLHALSPTPLKTYKKGYQLPGKDEMKKLAREMKPIEKKSG